MTMTTSTVPGITTATTTMTSEPVAAAPDELALLLTWFSPACPIGAFSYSHGLETLFENGGLDNAAATRAAVETALRDGAGRTDAILIAHAWRAARARDGRTLDDLSDLGLALSPSAERREETLRQGNAFAGLFDTVWPGALGLSDRDRPLPVVVGAAGGLHGVPLRPLLIAALHAFAANLVSAAVRLVPLGQTDGQRVTAALLPVTIEVAVAAETAVLDDITATAIGLDVCAMAHETQHVRLFRS
ncbi:urease accessory protein UreF [Acuticoccus sediminis]|nr:urease accessory protein UreF [Acuticoccus sediminis]